VAWDNATEELAIRLYNTTKERIVAPHVEQADTVWKRFVGLMGRQSIQQDHALLLDPCGSIHMFFMRFAIDVIFLDSQDKVVRIVRNLKPWRISAASGAKKVIEMAAGSLDDSIETGDQLKLE